MASPLSAATGELLVQWKPGCFSFTHNFFLPSISFSWSLPVHWKQTLVYSTRKHANIPAISASFSCSKLNVPFLKPVVFIHLTIHPFIYFLCQHFLSVVLFSHFIIIAIKKKSETEESHHHLSFSPLGRACYLLLPIFHLHCAKWIEKWVLTVQCSEDIFNVVWKQLRKQLNNQVVCFISCRCFFLSYYKVENYANGTRTKIAPRAHSTKFAAPTHIYFILAFRRRYFTVRIGRKKSKL